MKKQKSKNKKLSYDPEKFTDEYDATFYVGTMKDCIRLLNRHQWNVGELQSLAVNLCTRMDELQDLVIELQRRVNELER